MSKEGREAALRARFERLRALRSAWGALAPSGLGAPNASLAEDGRALSEELIERLAAEASDADASAVEAVDARLDELEQRMQQVAAELPLAQLRSTLPDLLGSDRRGVLDLLDLVLGAELAHAGPTEARIPVLDYLITLLAAGGDGDAPLQDPVTLTPRLYSLCQQCDADTDPRLPELEAEFFAAAEMESADACEELTLRTLRQRKVELGRAFFAPRVLRAIVTYNAALLRRVDEQLLASLDWGSGGQEAATDDAASVFESQALAKIAAALRRRAAGDPPRHDPVDRVAWCLDTGSLSAREHEQLCADSVGTREDVPGTTLLVGLLCRSAVVLDDELPAVGLSVERLTGDWLRELDDALRALGNERIAANDYDGARALSDLKGRFLSGKAAVPRRRTPRAAAPPPDTAQREARQITHQALDEPEARAATGLAALRALPWARVARSGAALAALVAALVSVNHIWFSPDRVSGDVLAQVSPYLDSGRRSAGGAGNAFVGTLHDGWSALSQADRDREAVALVDGLRERGLRDVMVYDGDGALRIQALGDGPARRIP